jgi:uncharacterized protein YjbJ (UPF0337 family)
MNRDRIEGSWKQLKGRIVEQWCDLRHDRSGMLAGRRLQIAGRMQKAYGLAAERSARQLSDWHRRMGQTQPGLHATTVNPPRIKQRTPYGGLAKVICITSAGASGAET